MKKICGGGRLIEFVFKADWSFEKIVEEFEEFQRDSGDWRKRIVRRFSFESLFGSTDFLLLRRVSSKTPVCCLELLFNRTDGNLEALEVCKAKEVCILSLNAFSLDGFVN